MLVVGGGINGAGIARDLAGRGLQVVLCERDDLAQHTSSASTKLVHGGLRYLEHREFGLVRKALAEREVLLRAAPHLIRPLRFVLPHDPSMRPAWLIRAGLFLYDHLAPRELLPASEAIDLRRHPAGALLKPGPTRGFVYSDGWADDARLVVANAIDAARRGATVRVRTACVAARRQDGADAHWDVTLRDASGGHSRWRTRALVNAAGPWAASLLADCSQVGMRKALRLVQGSHIVVRRRIEHGYGYLFQNPDRRILFVLPYESEYTLIGTTDVELAGGPPATARPTAEELDYLCQQASRWLALPVRRDEIVWSYAGVRPLLDGESGDPAALTRDYALELDLAGGAPLLNVWGGKLTTYRRLAEEAATLLAAPLGWRDRPWTANAPLPGGDLGGPQGYAAYLQTLLQRHRQLAPALVQRLAQAYGSRAAALLDEGLGAEVAPGLHEAELELLRREEWAHCADDVLWRRSKLGLHLTPPQREAVVHWFQSQAP